MQCRLVLVAITFLFSACGNVYENTPPERPFFGDEEAYRRASCAYAFDEGGNTSPQASSQYVYSSFNKLYDRSHFLAVAEASAENTVEYMKQTNVDIYKIESRISDCQMFSSLPRAHSNMQSEWDSTEIEGGIITGRYFPPMYNSNETPEIALRSDTERWTLVHEFFHHLFHKEITGRPEAERLERYAEHALEFESIEKKYLSTQSATDLAAYTKALLKLFNMEDPIRVGSTFEEPTIEAEMIELHDSGKLKFVPKDGVKNAINYIYSSSSQAITAYTNYFEKLMELRDENQNHGNYDFDLEIDEVLKLILARISEAQDLQYKYLLHSENNFSTSYSIVDQQSSRGCAHGKRYDDIFIKLNSSF